MVKRLLMGAAVVGLAVGPASAGQQPPTAQKAQKTMSAKSPDETFMTKAAMGGMAEVDLGKLAVEKASSEEVKKFGQRMVDDHGKAGDELKTLAQSKNVTLPTELDANTKALHDRLAKQSGPAFDRAYMQAMVADHKKDVNEFRTESKSGKDPETKAWASKTLPIIEEHLALAQSTNSAVGTSGTKSPK